VRAVVREFLGGPWDGETRAVPQVVTAVDTGRGVYVLGETRWGVMFVWKGWE